MKTIGLIGGMSWESTVSYYQQINRDIKNTLGGFHSAKIILFSLDFAEIEQMQKQGDWEQSAKVLIEAATTLEKAGADCLVICTNTMHKVADDISAAVGIPLIHIADSTAIELQQHNITKVGLLGTRFTMQETFYKNRLVDKFGIEVVVPSERQQSLVHSIIYQELCLGIIQPVSKDIFLTAIDDLVNDGAQAIILGCTEIGLLVQQNMTPARLFDTAAIHASKAAEFALITP
ncbi:MAG: aspartate/glutamate racemase family protein [Paraglaciecola sp.]|uniref:aspartate/glutamate racemase family protein n=1 Tax=Flavobacterium sp. W21_SRS_FM6 TaxID=3240268 RepID=UPI0027518214|nr:aspartate/glutamate racemase family protein [Paraglaciecola sp.]